MNAAPAWAEALVGVLLVASGIAWIGAAVGLVRVPTFFMRMHPPALACTFGAWAVALASIAWFSALESRPVLHAWVIPVLMAITVPVTTSLLARAALFRKRRAGMDVPPPLGGAPAGSGEAPAEIHQGLLARPGRERPGSANSP